MSGRQRETWNSFYRKNGRVWRGNCRIPNPLGGGKALDVGCGNGKSVSSLIDMGYAVCGIDFSEEAIRICGERFGRSTEFVCADIRAMPFADGSFDYVTAVHVLQHISDSDLPEVVSEIVRVLRPGGFLFVRDFAPGDFREDARMDMETEYFHRLPEDVVRLFDLDIVSSEVVKTRTRFGKERCRSEVLFRKQIENRRSDRTPGMNQRPVFGGEQNSRRSGYCDIILGSR